MLNSLSQRCDVRRYRTLAPALVTSTATSETGKAAQQPKSLPAASPPVAPQHHNVDRALKKLQGFIGLASVKEEVNSLSNFVRVQALRRQQGLAGHINVACCLDSWLTLHLEVTVCLSGEPDN